MILLLWMTVWFICQASSVPSSEPSLSAAQSRAPSVKPKPMKIATKCQLCQPNNQMPTKSAKMPELNCLTLPNEWSNNANQNAVCANWINQQCQLHWPKMGGHVHKAWAITTSSLILGQLQDSDLDVLFLQCQSTTMFQLDISDVVAQTIMTREWHICFSKWEHCLFLGRGVSDSDACLCPRECNELFDDRNKEIPG